MDGTFASNAILLHISAVVSSGMPIGKYFPISFPTPNIPGMRILDRSTLYLTHLNVTRGLERLIIIFSA